MLDYSPVILAKISLHNFRNFEKKAFDLNAFLTIIIGPNARGKTNLLEAIYFSINGSGFRESREEELMSFGKKEAYVQVVFQLKKDSMEYKIQLRLKKIGTEKKYFVNRTEKKHRQYGQDMIQVVLFSPEQIKIINDAPDIRRQYFNRLLSLFDYEYKAKLTNYENALRRRNKVLEMVHDESRLREELAFWNDYLIKQADYIVEKRRHYLDYLNQNPDLDHKKFRIDYLTSPINEQSLESIFSQEKRLRKTLVGPQKEDFHIYQLNHQEKNIHHFGSRSEQRLAVLWLKMNEIKFCEEKSKRKPILLLDDIFSELDEDNKKLVLSLVKKYQTCLTTTEQEMLSLIKVPQTIIKL